VKIGEQTWMAENLDYAVEGSKCYDNDPANCAIYGRLYNWATAKTVCPSGWHLPSDADWDILMNYVQTDNGSAYASGNREAPIAGKYLKATSGWNEGGNGEDKYGFAALPGGHYYGIFLDVGDIGSWWSYKEGDGAQRGMYSDGDQVGGRDCFKEMLLSVRCLQD
jgi:uncharacterized protein (TIGR02145 family)